MFLKPDVYRLDSTKGSYVYVVRNQHGITMIDTNFPGKADEILAELASVGLADVQRILLTHSDLDHLGNATEIAKRTGCSVYLSARELEAVHDPEKNKSRGEKRPLDNLELPQLVPLECESIAGITIVPAYGHTYGHTCYLYDGALFAGDLLCEEDGVIKEMQLHYIRDRKQSQEAVAWVQQNVTFDLLCPSHGEATACSSFEMQLRES